MSPIAIAERSSMYGDVQYMRSKRVVDNILHPKNYMVNSLFTKHTLSIHLSQADLPNFSLIFGAGHLCWEDTNILVTLD